MSSLDIAEPQVLVHFPDDGNEMYWHHRVLLCRAGWGATWVTLSPDHELCVHDLVTMRHVVLGRGAAIPAGQAPNAYIFDPIARVELNELKRRARAQARILAGDDDEEEAVDRMLWLVAGPGLERLGEEIPQDVRDDGARFRELGGRAVVELDGAVLWAERVDEAEKEKWLKERRAAEKDDRVLGVHLRVGKRFLPLREALGLFDQ